MRNGAVLVQRAAVLQAAQVGGRAHGGALAAVGQAAGQHLVGEHAQGVQVGAGRGASPSRHSGAV